MLPGRPPSCKPAATTAVITAAATEVFLAEGFEAASMDAIARRADVSKATLYAHFNSKDTLFTAVMQVQRSEYQRQLDELIEGQEGDIAERLGRVGISLLTFLLSPSKLRMFRVIIAESERIPEICQTFLKTGREHSYQRIAALFQSGIASGRLIDHDTHEAARLFVAALRGDLVWNSLFDPQHLSSPQAIEEHVTAVVQLMVQVYGKRELDKPRA